MAQVLARTVCCCVLCTTQHLHCYPAPHVRGKLLLAMPLSLLQQTLSQELVAAQWTPPKLPSNTFSKAHASFFTGSETPDHIVAAVVTPFKRRHVSTGFLFDASWQSSALPKHG